MTAAVPIRYLDKAKLLPNDPKRHIFNGYAERENNPIQGILIHSTNNPKGNTTFQAEVDFLYRSKKVGAEFIVGDLEIVQFLGPRQHYAFHAGEVRNIKFSNIRTIGVEVHYSPADKQQPINSYKIDNLTYLIKLLLKGYNLTPADISLHRLEATPKGRKIDPNFWSDAQFEVWRGKLLTQSMIADSIMNGPQVDSIKLYRALNTYANHLSAQEKEQIVSAFTTFGELTTIGNLYPFAQSAKETAWFTSERWIKNRNSAGLGATNDGAEGYIASSVADGILRQYAHLLCYATRPGENSILLETIAQLSPRIKQMEKAFGRGSAKTWVELNAKWAYPGNGYGESILDRAEKIMEL